MKWVIGLGNPGSEYAKTRHNVGFMAIDQISAKLGVSVTQSKYKALYGEGRLPNGSKVALIKPMTYMNLSGESMRAYMDFYKVKLEDAIVIYDDLDTVFGQIRLRYQGSSGGHNGIKSIVQHMGTQIFNRVRIGISRPEPGRNIADYVLSDFTKAEAAELPALLARTTEAALEALQDPFEKVMAKYNR